MPRPPDASARTPPTTPREPPHDDRSTTTAAGALIRIPAVLRRPVAGAMGQWPGRILVRTSAALVRVQIFDRSMTIAAQAFTSLFPVLILLAALSDRRLGARLADLAHLPEASRHLLDDALSGATATFGVLGSIVVLISATSLARALARAYGSVWELGRLPSGLTAAWRWLAAVLLLAGLVVATRLLGWLTGRFPAPHVSSAVAVLVIDCAVTVVIPWLLSGGAVPVRRLLPGGCVFALMMAAVRPAGEVYLPRALTVSEDRYGTIGLAFTYIGWLYVLSFCLLAAAVLGRVVGEDEGVLGRLTRGAPAGHSQE